jgi:uncharacterized protein (TIGR02172 family)
LAITTKLRKVAEGREAEMFEWGDGKIVRLGRGEDAEAQVNWQELTLRQAAACGIRVPRTYERVEVDGRPGLVMERIGGKDLLTAVGEKPWQIWSVAKICSRVHVQMHNTTAPAEVPPLKERMRMMLASEKVPADVREFALAELDGLPDGDRLLHGDFHAGNIMLDGEEPVVLDWSNVTRGDPMADVARTWMMHRLGSVPPGTGLVLRVLAAFGRRFLINTYVSAYGRERPLDMGLMRRWAAVRVADRLAEGIEEEREGMLRFVRGEMRKR